MQALQEYKCPCCGGALAFDSSVQKMKCPFCDTEFAVEALESYDEVLSEDGADSMEWEISAGGEWERLKMDPSLVAYIDREYGRQDWRSPKASALYWAHRGLAQRPKGAVRAELRQVLYQTLMLESLDDPRFAPRALRAMKDAYIEAPSLMLKDMILRYRAKFSL